MADIDEGYEFDHDEFSLQIYELLNTFLASRALAELRKSEIEAGKNTFTERKHNEPLESLQRDYFLKNISHLILGIAGMSRVIEKREKDNGSHVEFICGELYQPVDNAKSKGLSLREACNKIIHAQKIVVVEGVLKFDRRPEGQKYYEPRLSLFGRQGKEEWRAEIDVIKFCRGNLSLPSY